MRMKILNMVRYNGKPHKIKNTIEDVNNCHAILYKDNNGKKVIAAYIDYNLDSHDNMAGIGHIGVYEPNDRGKGFGKDLICHVLKQLPLTHSIELSASADPSLDGKGLKQKQLEEYYGKFTYGLFSKKHIEFKSRLVE